MATPARTPAPRPRLGGPDALVRATLEVVAREGVPAVTVRSVARQAGASPGTVTHHFGSIDALLLAALQHGATAVVAELERLALDLAADGDRDAWAQAAVDVLARSIDEHPEHHLACFELRLLGVRREELRDVVAGIDAAYLRLARMLLGPGADDAAAGRLVAVTVGAVLGELTRPARGRRGRLLALLGA